MADFLNDLSSQVVVAVDNMLTHTKLQTSNDNLQLQKEFLLSQSEEEADFFFESDRMKIIMQQVGRVADSDVLGF